MDCLGWIFFRTALPNGKVLWMFGDTYLDNLNPADTTVPCLFQVRNSMMVQDNVDRNKFITILDQTKNDINRTPVKLVDNDSTLFWPADGYVRGDTAITFWFRYHSSKLTNLGIYVVKIYWPDLTDATSIKSIKKIPVNNPGINEFEFGNALIQDTASNYLYIYGHKRNWIMLESFLARCPLDNVMGTWEFYDGSGWTTDLSSAKKISIYDVSPSFDVVKIQDKYYLITQENGYLTCGLGRQIFAYSSDTPYGPFVNKQTIWVINNKYKGSYMITYNATAHPEFNKNGELLVGYNVNGICPSECQNAWTDRLHAETYRPKFVRVPFAVLDTGYRFQPQAEIEASSTTGNPPFRVNFSARTSLGDGGIASYFWDFGDGSVSNAKEPFHYYARQGVFTAKLIVTDSKQQTDTATISISSGTTGTSDINDISNNFCVYPNPTKDSFTVEISDFDPTTTTRLSVVNSSGIEVIKDTLDADKSSYQLKGNGMYFVTIMEGDKQSTVKLIKQE